ncbi:hypothetical protein HOD19_03035 [bacterium]|mgnify:CR=1 FL=1|jgi:hypothetical protein|nr:hypothetical protein [bacterium]MBT4648875.1 hypothetical protein [bacterium]
MQEHFISISIGWIYMAIGALILLLVFLPRKSKPLFALKINKPISLLTNSDINIIKRASRAMRSVTQREKKPQTDQKPKVGDVRFADPNHVSTKEEAEQLQELAQKIVAGEVPTRKLEMEDLGEDPE